MKLAKILYKNQKEVWNKAEEYLDKLLSNYDCIEHAYVWASLAENKFGIYETPYNNRTGSDIDLVIVMKEFNEIPEDWNFTKVEKSWFDLYEIGNFKYAGNEHPIDGLIVIPLKHDLNKMNTALKGRSKKLF
ncbi:hypothetical protein HOA59_00960 [archaeon]|jgi:predicted nucleotidyltransferase|nr:hypothetical protein [archaeon]MBT6823988.1 hypothetical protein [archaeon]MBT7107221.1 hypothetical protein [archaeon]MBT7297142.1 hypothetical protein [archaeon]